MKCKECEKKEAVVEYFGEMLCRPCEEYYSGKIWDNPGWNIDDDGIMQHPNPEGDFDAGYFPY